MTVDQARKILGKTSDNLPDSVIADYIESAELLKSIFLDVTQNDVAIKLWHNDLVNDKQTKSDNLH